MATLTKQAYEAMSDKERELLLKVVSTDNVLRGMPSFQEWCAAQHGTQRKEQRTMNEHPIIFSAEMVRAILDNRKTQTRRVANQDFRMQSAVRVLTTTKADYFDFVFPDETGMVRKCPYGLPGDVLWVRETFALERRDDEPEFVADRPTQYNPGDESEWSEEYWLVPHYKATDPAPELCYEDDENDDGEPKCKWKPSIFMPRWASRITLEIVSVRVERVRDISKTDAKAEGVYCGFEGDKDYGFSIGSYDAYTANFRYLWDKLSATRGFGWDANPWVWVIEFKKAR